jgi:hypothetical protein
VFPGDIGVLVMGGCSYLGSGDNVYHYHLRILIKFYKPIIGLKMINSSGCELDH